MNAKLNTHLWRGKRNAASARWELGMAGCAYSSNLNEWSYIPPDGADIRPVKDVQEYYRLRALAEMATRGTERLEGCAMVAAFAIDGLVTAEITDLDEVAAYLGAGQAETEHLSAVVGIDPTSKKLRVERASFDSIEFYFSLGARAGAAAPR